jgi:hypothetical protein
MKMDSKTINILSETIYTTCISKYGLSDAKKIIANVKKKLLEESKRRKEKNK